MPKTFRQWLPYALGGASFVALLLALLTPAPADTIPKQPVAQRQAASYSAVKFWQGCGGGVHGAGVVGEAGPITSGAPVNLSADGELVGVHAVCDVQMGHGAGALVVGIEGNIDYVAGDLNTLGGRWAWGPQARVGVLATPSALLYGTGGWRRLELDKAKTGLDTLDGWVFGGGLELRLPTNTPLFFDMRVQHVSYDNPGNGFPSGVKLTSDEARLGVTWKFGPTYVPNMD